MRSRYEKGKCPLCRQVDIMHNNTKVFGTSYFIFCTHSKYHYADQIKENEMGGIYDAHGVGKENVQGFDGKARRKESLGRPRHRWYDGIRTDLREIGWGTVEWIQLAHDRGRWPAIVNTVMD
jgi:hypothetical protein